MNREATLSKYTKLWNLSDFEKIDYDSANIIYKCISVEHGSCMLKIGDDSKEVGNQFNALREYNGRRFCKAYQVDIDNEVLLIENIIPGTELREEENLDKRLDLFCELFQGLHIKPADKSIYPTYMDWVRRITEYMRGRDDYKLLYEKMARAEEICQALCSKYSGEMLLHGDLHHDNILLGENNQYKIIDPKGVVGDSVFDIPRFIINEFDDEIDDDLYKKFTYITMTLSKKLGVPEFDIRRLVYVEKCMESCWCVEDDEKPNMGEVLFAERLMDGYEQENNE